jgi:hypothetical protein
MRQQKTKIEKSNWRTAVSSISLLLVVGLAACDQESAKERQLMQEVKTANEKIAELQNALGEKERYLKLVLENPDKAAFDLLRRRDSTSQPTEQALEEMQNQYGAFLAKFPTSPLTVEVVKMNGEIDRLIKNAVRTKESRARFDKVATLKLIDVTAFPQKYIGVTFRTRSVEETRAVGDRMWADLAPAVADGSLSLPISATFPFERLGDAYAMMSANRHFGKIVVTLV